MPPKARPRAGAAPRKSTVAAPAKRAARPAAAKPADAVRAGATSGANEADVFAALKSIFQRQAKDMLVTQDGPRGYQVSMKQQFRGKPFWLGGVRWGKSYVSFHLMTVYMFPDQLAGISPELKRRMQGKSCFNFKTADPQLLRELEALTKAGIARMKQDGPAILAKYEKR